MSKTIGCWRLISSYTLFLYDSMNNGHFNYFKLEMYAITCICCELEILELVVWHWSTSKGSVHLEHTAHIYCTL